MKIDVHGRQKNASNASTVLMGLQRSEKILQVNEQLRRRYSRHIELLPFKNNDDHDRSIFSGIISHFDRVLGLPEPLSLDDDLVRRFHFATNGIIDYIVRLMIGGYALAVAESQLALNRKVLECAFSERVWFEGTGKLNPFNDKFTWERLDKPGMPFNQFNQLESRRAAI